MSSWSFISRSSVAPSSSRAIASTSARRIDVNERQDEAAILRQAAALLRVGQRFEMAGDGSKLVGEAARVRLVEQQQIEHECQHRIETVARAIGDEAVGQLQKQKQAARHLLGCPEPE